MSGPRSSARQPGRLRRLLGRLASAEEDEAYDSLPQETESETVTRIGECHDRQIVRVTGDLRTVTLRPRAGVPALQAELFDGSDSLDLVWLGRRAITGIEPGRGLTASGRITMSHGRRVLFNPKYELRPSGQEQR
jgi:hypothetical protein